MINPAKARKILAAENPWCAGLSDADTIRLWEGRERIEREKKERLGARDFSGYLLLANERTRLAFFGSVLI